METVGMGPDTRQLRLAQEVAPQFKQEATHVKGDRCRLKWIVRWPAGSFDDVERL